MRSDSQKPWYRKVKNCWYCWHDGKQVSLGVKGEHSEREASAAFNRLLNGQGGRPDEKVVPNELTLSELVSAFLDDAESRLKPSTTVRYGTDLNQLVKIYGSLPAKQFNQIHLLKWLNGLKCTSTSKAIAHRSVSACLGWASKEPMNLLDTNPATKIKKAKCRSRSAEAVISECDHAALMKRATRQFRLVLRVLHGTGCRPGEVGRITTENFHPESGCVILTEHKTDETGRPRILFLTSDLVSMLNEQKAKFGSGALLRSKYGIAWTGRSITEAMGRLKKKLRIKAIAYGYRHTFATDALVKGVPDTHVASLLGHTNTNMLHKHYSHLGSRADILRKAAEQVR